MMGEAAAYYVHNGFGRPIDQEEALTILAQAEEKALVLQPSNSKNSDNICMCCGCCCGVLRTVAEFSLPTAIASSDFVAVVDDDAPPATADPTGRNPALRGGSTRRGRPG